MSPLDPVQSEAPSDDAVAVAVEPDDSHAPPAPSGDGAAVPVLEGRFVSVDKSGSITTWSARAEEAFGFVRAEVAGQPLAKVVAPGSQEHVREELNALLAGGPARQLDIEAMDAQGREFPATLSLVPIGLAAGYAFNSLLQDLTKQAITPEALVRLRKTHVDVLDSIRSSLETAEGGGDEERVVGALVMFEDRGSPRPAAGDEPQPGPVELPVETLGQLDEVKRAADHARRDAQEAEARAQTTAAELNALRGETDELREKLEAARAELEEARGKLAEKGREVAEATDAARAASAEAEQRETRLAETDAAANALQAELAELRAEMAETGQRADELSRELATASARAEELSGELEAAQARSDELSRELDAANARSDELSGELAAAKAATEERGSELAEARSALEEARRRAGEADAELEDARARAEAARAAAEEVRADAEAARAGAKEARADAEAARADAKEARGDAEAARAEVEQARAQIEERDRRAEEIGEDGAQVRAELEGAQAELAETRERAEHAQAAADELQARLAEVTQDSGSRDGELDRARSELEAARASAGEAEQRVGDLTAELETARHEATDAARRAEQLSEELEAARADASSSHEASAGEAEAARTEAEAARSEVETARREAEEASAAAAEAHERAKEGERFRLAFDHATIGMALTATDGRFLRVNRSLCELLGYSAEQLLEQDPPAIVHDEDVEARRELAQRMLAGESSTEQVETRYLHAEGRTLHVNETVSLARAEDGEPVHFVFQLEDVTDRKQLEEAAAGAVDRDPVTGLFNKRRFEEELSRKIAEAAHHGGGGAAVLLNLEDLDSLAGDLPEEAGDELLRTIASALRDHLRNAEVLARLSGDEFAVLLPDADAEKAQSVAEELLQAIGPQVVKVGDRSIRITLSVGVALFDERDHHSGPVPVEAIAGATESDNLPVPVGGRSSLVPLENAPVAPDRVHRALQEDLFLLYCQPIVDMRTNDVAQYEVLLRMADEDGSLILPRAFLQTAEESGLIRSIDHWVVRRAIHLIAERAQAGKQVRLEVNISGGSIDDPDLPAVIEQELITTGADPSSLILEVSEMVATSRHEQVKELAKRVRALGCRFAVDNFGSAVTNFRYIKDLPLDFLKLDGDLIATLPESRTDQLVVKAIVDIARGMGCETIAEMVADDETLFLLRQQGVGYAQGYQVGRPHPVAEI